MASESPGQNYEEFHILDNQQDYRDQNQCLSNATPHRRSAPAIHKNVVITHVLCLLLLVSGSGVTGEGLCDPLLCTCHVSSANCSYRGFLSLPSGLQEELISLGNSSIMLSRCFNTNVLFADLSNNDIQEINRTELSQYRNLEYLDLSRNRIISFEGNTECPKSPIY